MGLLLASPESCGTKESLWRWCTSHPLIGTRPFLKKSYALVLSSFCVRLFSAEEQNFDEYSTEFCYAVFLSLRKCKVPPQQRISPFRTFSSVCFLFLSLKRRSSFKSPSPWLCGSSNAPRTTSRKSHDPVCDLSAPSSAPLSMEDPPKTLPSFRSTVLDHLPHPLLSLSLPAPLSVTPRAFVDTSQLPSRHDPAVGTSRL